MRCRYSMCDVFTVSLDVLMTPKYWTSYRVCGINFYLVVGSIIIIVFGCRFDIIDINAEYLFNSLKPCGHYMYHHF